MTCAKVIELVGCSTKSWEDATKEALKTACTKCKEVKGIKIIGQTAKVKDGKINEYRVNVKVAFSMTE